VRIGQQQPALHGDHEEADLSVWIESLDEVAAVTHGSEPTLNGIGPGGQPFSQDGGCCDLAIRGLTNEGADRTATFRTSFDLEIDERGAWCPYCNLTLRAYENDLVPELSARGAGLIAITVQKPEGLEAMRESNALSFGAYSDHTGTVIDALGIWTSPSDEVAAIQEQFDLKIPEMSVEGSYRVPMPTTLIVDRDGVIRFIDVHPNVSTRTEVADILEGRSA
jgi:peroxiredoxin